MARRLPSEAFAVAAGIVVGVAIAVGVRAALGAPASDATVHAAWTNTLALVVAAAALALAAATRRVPARLPPRLAAFGGAVTATLAVAVWANLGTVQLPYHRWEQFHYFIGAKYFPELGYSHLYRCTAVAEAERFGRADVVRRSLHDLERDTIVPAAGALADAEDCKRRFTPARWAAFVGDVAWFRAATPAWYWARMQTDHGFNPPPPWTVAGWTLASLAPAGRATQTVLALLDLVLLALAFGLVGWAFGARVLWVTLVVWGCAFPAVGTWTLGGFLREDWFLCTIAAVCLARRDRPLLAGAALATAAALRLFPAFLAGLPACIAARHVVRERRVPAPYVRFAAGAAAAAVFWLAVSTALFGPGAWRGFARHMAVHRAAPLANDVGLRALLAQSWTGRLARTEAPGETDPYVAWRAARRATFAARRPVWLGLVAVVLALVAWASRRTEALWQAIAGSAALVMALVDLASYYYAFCAGLALLAATGAAQELLALGAAVVGRLVNALPILRENVDVRYTLQSLVFFAWAVSALVVLGRGSGGGPANERLSSVSDRD